MYFFNENNSLISKNGNETIQIEPWGENALRVRVTKSCNFSGKNNALSFIEEYKPEIKITDEFSIIRNGKISCKILKNGCMMFLRGENIILKEYYRGAGSDNDHSEMMRFDAREFKPASGNDYGIALRFEANEEEKIYGMGQYQQSHLDLKGCVLELAQRNSQVSIPFYISSLGYGFLWNNPGIGEVTFGANYTQWRGRLSDEIDYWITADDTPKKIMENYTSVTGRAPEFPDNALGLWQCKLRYRTQDELLRVAREYKRRGIPLDVIIIDYFHWIRQGEWSFDPEYWPDPQKMIEELKEMGIRCMVSVWPTVDKKSVNYKEMRDKGMLVRTDYGTPQCLDFLGDTVFYDAFNPETREFVWKKINENYYKYGIDMFWLDACEPEFGTYGFENYRYYSEPALKISNMYPMYNAKIFYDGLKAAGKTDIVNLSRSAWAGSQKYASVVWSGDIKASFAALREQISAGLSIGIAGIPWWTTDTGGFFSDVTDEQFNELLVRWFQFSTFCPVLRMHGFRGPCDIPRLSELDYGGGFCETGRPNELWSYGEEVYEILKKYLDIRLSMKDYIKSVMNEASTNGWPVIRAMFFEFPEDEICYNIRDQYMFGSKYLVAPVLYQGMTERKVYLPEGKWRSIHDGKMFGGNQTITASAPIDIIPVFEKM